MKYTIGIHIICGFLIGIILTLIDKKIEVDSITKEIEEISIPIEEVPQLSIQDSIYNYILECKIEHPKIVMAQFILETGHFTSDSFKKGHNCSGMKLPKQRPTTAIGTLYDHAAFLHWKDCVIDYLWWQQKYCTSLTKEEYLKYLQRVYSTNSNYSNTVVEVKKYNLKK